MRRVGKHVDGLHPLHAVAAADELAEIARQRGGIARHVDDAFRAELGERLQLRVISLEPVGGDFRLLARTA